MKSKKFKYDGRSRPTTDLYKENFNRIFGKKIKKDEEVTGYYINGYEDKGIQVLTKKKDSGVKKVINTTIYKENSSRTPEQGPGCMR